MYANCTGAFFGVHSDIIMPYISNYGSKEQVKRFIPEMTAGRCIGAIAMTEPGAGRSASGEGEGGCTATVFIRNVLIKPLASPYSDLQGIRTYAKRDGSDWILNGSKVKSTSASPASLS